ncbi:MAG: hypothetical protein ACKVP2_06110 [Burkholderiales bacterium]
MSNRNRVAIVAVHGIADQRPGQTGGEIARLLCSGGNDGPRYVQGEAHSVLVAVEKLEPGAAPGSPAPVSVDSERRQPEWSRHRPGTPSGFYQAQRTEPAGLDHAAQATLVSSESDAKAQDLGIALNDYLLGRHKLSAHDALYESTRISLRRRADRRPVDIYELYWADLSRLGTGGMRALSALYQLFFHLNTLAADVIDQIALASGAGAGWRGLQRLHAWMAWLMKAPAALVQLAMLLLVAFGATAFVPKEQQGQLLAVLFGMGAIGFAVLAVFAWLHGHALAARSLKTLLLSSVAFVSLMVAIVAPSPENWWMHRLYFGACVLTIALLGAYLIERFARVTHGVRVFGHLLVMATAIALCVEGWRVISDVTTAFEWMLVAALHVGEGLFALMLMVWATFVVVQIAALLLGFWLGRTGSAAVRNSLHTARLALVASTALFALLSLVLWSVIAYVAGLALHDLPYMPALFGSGYLTVPSFFDARLQNLGGLFTPLVLAFGLLASLALLVLAPSFLEEIAPSADADARGAQARNGLWSQRLGAWLTTGMRWLGKIFGLLVPVGALLGGMFYLAYLFREFAASAGILDELAGSLNDILVHFRGETLVATGKWLAGGAVTIIALGARFTQTFGKLRVALDAVLDVDNYFGDPRNRLPPRARIFSRFASLLARLREEGYARIVIVSHSQGTVISADLLRYLHVQGRLQAVVGTAPIALVTAGSPLRDLYAARFPLLYRWMGQNPTDFATAAPAASDIGAMEWVNTCRSGDYVGRHLWTPSSDGARYCIAAIGENGKVQAQRAGDRAEFCLGAGGHTHYFDPDAVTLAAEIDRLVTG